MKKYLFPALILASACGSTDRERDGWYPEETGEASVTTGPETECSPHCDAPTIPTDPTPSLAPSCNGKSILEFRGNTMWRIEMDGTQTEIFGFEAPTDSASHYVHLSDWQSEGDFHAVTASVSNESSGFFYEVFLFSDDGTIHHHKTLPSTEGPTLHFGPDGNLAVELARSESYLVHKDGQPLSLGQYHPMSATDKDEILARDQALASDSGVRFGWLNPATKTFRALSHTPKSNYTLNQVGDQILYLSTDNKLVLESPTHQSAVDHPEDVRLWSNGRRAPLKGDFVGFSNDQGAFRADLRGDTLVVEPVILPNEPNWLLAPDVRADGAILTTRTVESGIEAIISEDLGQTWQALSAPIPQRRTDNYAAVAQLHANGNVLLMEVTVGYGYFLESAQAITPTSTSTLTTHGVYTGGPYDFNGTVDFADDGGCAVMWSLVSNEDQFEGPFDLVAIDYSSQEHTVLRTADRVSDLRFAR